MNYFKRKAQAKRALELQKQLDQNYLKNDQTIEKGQGLNHEHYKKVLEATKGRRSAHDQKVIDFVIDFIAFSQHTVFREAAKIALGSGRSQEFVDMLMHEYQADHSNLKSAIGKTMYNRFLNDFLS
jgi:hypothetical protein